MLGVIAALGLVIFAFTTPGRMLLGGGLALAGLGAALVLWKESAAAAVTVFLVLGGLGGWIYPDDGTSGSSSSTGSSSSFARCVEEAIDGAFILWLDGWVEGPWDEAAARRGAERGCA